MSSVPEQGSSAVDPAGDNVHVQQIPQHHVIFGSLFQHADEGRGEADEVLDELSFVCGLVVPRQSYVKSVPPWPCEEREHTLLNRADFVCRNEGDAVHDLVVRAGVEHDAPVLARDLHHLAGFFGEKACFGIVEQNRGRHEPPIAAFAGSEERIITAGDAFASLGVDAICRNDKIPGDLCAVSQGDGGGVAVYIGHRARRVQFCGSAGAVLGQSLALQVAVKVDTVDEIVFLAPSATTRDFNPGGFTHSLPVRPLLFIRLPEHQSSVDVPELDLCSDSAWVTEKGSSGFLLTLSLTVAPNVSGNRPMRLSRAVQLGARCTAAPTSLARRDFSKIWARRGQISPGSGPHPHAGAAYLDLVALLAEGDGSREPANAGADDEHLEAFGLRHGASWER